MPERMAISGEKPGELDGAALLGRFFVVAGVSYLCGGIRCKFRVQDAAAISAEPAHIYLLGLGYGFADFAAVSAVCWVAAMVLGAAVARPEVLPVMAGVSVLFVLMNVTLERLIGSWLEKILAKRKTRELFIGLFVCPWCR